ncbi:hypothetical protein AAKU55_005073 [Oxalobacteraceae bacterium GrIS 1.11]
MPSGSKCPGGTRHVSMAPTHAGTTSRVLLIAKCVRMHLIEAPDAINTSASDATKDLASSAQGNSAPAANLTTISPC